MTPALHSHITHYTTGPRSVSSADAWTLKNSTHGLCFTELLTCRPHCTNLKIGKSVTVVMNSTKGLLLWCSGKDRSCINEAGVISTLTAGQWDSLLCGAQVSAALFQINNALGTGDSCLRCRHEAVHCRSSSIMVILSVYYCNMQNENTKLKRICLTHIPQCPVFL